MGKETVPLPEREKDKEGPKHVLVTGGAGYIGSHAALRLLEEGLNVTVLDDLSRGNLGAIKVLEELARPGQFQFIKADLTDLEELHEVFAMNDFDVVMHFAALTYVGESMTKPLLYYQINTGNIVNVLDAMRVHNVTKFIYSSTCATYGDPKQMPVNEETPQVPINPYGLSKKMAEEVIKDYANSNKQFSAAILRYFNVVGADPSCRLGEAPSPALKMYSRLTTACVDATLGRLPCIKIFGTNHPTEDGTCVRDYIHVLDLVNAHVAAMNHLTDGEVQIFNVGTGRGHSVRDFIAAWRKVTGKSINVEEIPEMRAGDTPKVYCDPSKLENELGWKPEYADLESALATAWSWHQANPDGYSSSS
ncbi:UDP-glucose 4-epimerase [Marchantia polymorpha subsp. ruderalis]|uniref:UDP-glucose 4-epimerase n=1 Tax=Marchantia polymorpha TaxID=3197 RepID=A0A2R6XJH9_MARPO|nr:hypothetical protein MARPO_0012s0160 [Marchantia polymorpha]PTQ46233.1 hypothetical protein MARPO_0012s0160 [Marchantia polymorpha]BBN18585.1 hypothetical protein Mp_8g03700 [Marchantia polymorpha subsp. ruderalis]BBN18586.1 hypothetical protein Mp_8g03700 [Marchantia polymorpha subsp. ruderalis]|eukprot:PTQ46232.1 hypothetical protein MARPO_0012s0160 [Marchantia polymorpha]